MCVLVQAALLGQWQKARAGEVVAMKIRRPRGLTGAQIGLATVLGVLGGIYIWKPLLEKVPGELKAVSVKKSDSE